MRLHPQTAELLAAAAALGAPRVEHTTPQAARATRRAARRPSPEPIAESRDTDAGGVAARLYRPASMRSRGLLVWFHGGGWVLGDLDGQDDQCRAIANRGGFCVLSVDYRLAPEHPFPAALDDAVKAVRWARDHAAELGCDPLIAVGGESAGGNLAAYVANHQVVPFCFQLLVYPVTDGRMLLPSMEEHAEGYFLTAPGMRWFYGHYLSGGEGSPDDPRVSPLVEDPARLAAAPPTLVITAELDVLRDEGAAYAARLADAAVPTTYVCFGGQVHGFFGLFGLLDDARSAHALAAEAVHTAFARAHSG